LVRPTVGRKPGYTLLHRLEDVLAPSFREPQLPALFPPAEPVSAAWCRKWLAKLVANAGIREHSANRSHIQCFLAEDTVPCFADFKDCVQPLSDKEP
jgi:hypothetical protein